MDEAAEEVVMFFAELYESLGYPVVFSSTKVDGGSADLLAQLEKGDSRIYWAVWGGEVVAFKHNRAGLRPQNGGHQ